jgi:DNA-directed RNA polymerase subunit RPC12/RpoP
MSDDIVKALLNSLTPEQKNDLVQSLLNSNVKSDEVTPQDKEVSQESNVKEDFTVTRSEDFLEKRKTVVRARKNQWIDDGEDRDPDFDPAKFERMGRTSRNRGKAKKKTIECHVCGKTFSINASLVHGEYIRCNKCTGR